MTVGTAAARLAFSAWLAYLAAADLRKGEVTNWATVPPLLAAVAWQAINGGWGIVVALVLILAGAQWPPFATVAVALMPPCVLLVSPQGLDVTVWVWISVYALWQIGVIGGADAKVVMALTAVFSDGRLAWLLLLCWFGLSMVYLLHRHGRRAPRALLKATQGLVRFRVLEEEGERYPALPAVALAGLIYVWFYSVSL